MQVDLACGMTLEQAIQQYRLTDVQTAGFELSARVVKFRKTVLTAVMDKAMEGDLASIVWLEERGYAARSEPVERDSTEGESESSDS